MAVSYQTTGGGGVYADNHVALHCDRVWGGRERKESESSAVGGSE